MIWQGR
jgi:hypothetical protein